MSNLTYPEIAISMANVSRMFKRYRRPGYRVLEAFGFPVPKHAFDEFWALRGISLELRRGESLGLIGQNGAGKSTLLSIICGRLPATSGTVTVRGNIQALMDLGTGFHPEFTGRQNVFSALAYQGVRGGDAGYKFEEIVAFSELADFIDQPIKTYSSGMYARLAFSTATAIVPDVLIIDEILGTGDAYFSAKCAERMRGLTQDTGATVLFVSHDIAAVQRICRKAIWIDQGQVRMEGDTLDISKAYYADVTAREEARLRAATTRAIARMRSRDGGSPEDESGQSLRTPVDSHGRRTETFEPAPATSVAASEPMIKPSSAEIATAADGEAGFRDKWESDEARFTEIAACNPKTGELQHVFGFGEGVEFRIVVELRAHVPQCWLACIIFDALGNRVSLLVHEFKSELERGRNSIHFRIEKLDLRQGEYSVSFELLPVFDYHWPGPQRIPYLCHWDRCIHFKIDEGYHGTISLGLLALSAQVMVTASERVE